MIALGLIYAAWKVLPSDKKAVRQRLNRLLQVATIRRTESTLARLAYANQLTDFFTPDAELHLDGMGAEATLITGRTELLDAALAARAQIRKADFVLADIAVTTLSGEKSAKAYAVVTGHLNNQTNQFGQAFKMTLIKTNGQWFIDQLKTVRGVR